MHGPINIKFGCQSFHNYLEGVGGQTKFVCPEKKVDKLTET